MSWLISGLCRCTRPWHITSISWTVFPILLECSPCHDSIPHVKYTLFPDSHCLFQGRTCSTFPFLPPHFSDHITSPWLKSAPLLPKQSFPFKACLFLKDTWEWFHFCYKLLPHPEIHHKKWKGRAAEPWSSFLPGNLGAVEAKSPRHGGVPADGCRAQPYLQHLHQPLNQRLPPLQSLMI